jgi:hypothetical protein
LFQATCPIVKRKAKNFVSGLIVPDDLPDSENAKKLASGLIVSGDLPDSENVKKLASGLIVQGDLPDDKMRRNSQVV